MIQCAACKAENDSQAITCATCQADLLPGVSTSERWKLFGMLGFFAVVTGGLAYLSYRISQGAVCIGIAIVLGLLAVLMLAGGTSEMFARTPPWHRYWLRAKRHKKIDPEQAIADATRALDLAPKKEQGELLGFRAEMYAQVGQLDAARRDGQTLIDGATRALEKATAADRPKRLAERAKLYGRFGMTAEYAADIEAEIELHSQTLASAPPQHIEKILRDRSTAHRKLGHERMANRDLVDALRAAEAFALKAEFKMGDGAKGLAGLAGLGGDAFEVGYANQARKDELKRIRDEQRKLVKAGTAAMVGYCAKCKDVVDLDIEGRCLRGHGPARRVVTVHAEDIEAAKETLRQTPPRRK